MLILVLLSRGCQSAFSALRLRPSHKRFCTSRAIRYSRHRSWVDRWGSRQSRPPPGVSTTTVSHALNGKGRISDETRRHVREVADRLGYQPSAMARGLAGGRTGMLALVVSGAEDFSLQIGDFDYFLQLMNGATSSALRRGFSLTMLQTDGDLQVLDGLPLDGAIVIDPVAHDRIVERLTERGVPVVTTGRDIDGPQDACWVDNDHVAGTRDVLDHLTAARRPAHRAADRAARLLVRLRRAARLPRTGVRSAGRSR